MAAVTAVTVQDKQRNARLLKHALGNLRTAQRVLAAPMRKPYGAVRLHLLGVVNTRLNAALDASVERMIYHALCHRFKRLCRIKFQLRRIIVRQLAADNLRVLAQSQLFGDGIRPVRNRVHPINPLARCKLCPLDIAQQHLCIVQFLLCAEQNIARHARIQRRHQIRRNIPIRALGLKRIIIAHGALGARNAPFHAADVYFLSRLLF